MKIANSNEKYCKIPALFLRQEITKSEEVYCVLIATWIYTYSKLNHILKLENAVKIFKNQGIRDIIDGEGHRYCLSISEYKDQFHRRKINIKFNFKQYAEKLKEYRQSPADAEITDEDLF